ncbi:unnamed protein product [Darwinula stevensoni]|uniref:Uncharacterized protein n=1 Tax=Darwinula stevensoni TaxID=69355 RepID=A0A7R9A3S3_9CRUS|nr:unnamed protein product [Darwinula stevensoni]CAG0881912.1 unnamed protein product [Darwinula stevensoni]
MSLVENTSEGVGGCDGSICIKWPGFSTHIEDLMAQLWRDEAETDVHVVCQDGTVKVHAIIIALFSPSMAEMLKTCQVQDDHGVTILMPDFHLQDLTKFFYLLYHHHTELVASDASVLSEIASCLTMDLSLSGPFGDHLVSSKPLRKSKVEDDPEVPLKENCLNQDDEKEAFKPLKKRKKCSNGAKKKFPDGAQRKRRLKVSNKDKARQSPVEEVALDDTLENAMLKIISTEDLQEKDTVATEDENKIPEDEGSMDFKCPKCGKTLKACTKQRMEQHLRTHEAKNRLYTCDDCPRTFSHASVLRDHKRVHSVYVTECLIPSAWGQQKLLSG